MRPYRVANLVSRTKQARQFSDDEIKCSGKPPAVGYPWQQMFRLRLLTGTRRGRARVPAGRVRSAKQTLDGAAGKVRQTSATLCRSPAMPSLSLTDCRGSSQAMRCSRSFGRTSALILRRQDQARYLDGAFSAGAGAARGDANWSAVNLDRGSCTTRAHLSYKARRTRSQRWRRRDDYRPRPARPAACLTIGPRAGDTRRPALGGRAAPHRCKPAARRRRGGAVAGAGVRWPTATTNQHHGGRRPRRL